MDDHPTDQSEEELIASLGTTRSDSADSARGSTSGVAWGVGGSREGRNK